MAAPAAATVAPSGLSAIDAADLRSGSVTVATGERVWRFSTCTPFPAGVVIAIADRLTATGLPGPAGRSASQPRPLYWKTW